MKLQDIEGYTPITAKAIENLKCTRIISGEGSDKYNKYIQSLAKKVLITSLNRTDSYKHDEVGILARLDGTYSSKPILGYWNESIENSIIPTGNNLEYNFMLDDNENHSLFFIHNHPNNSRLSINDIMSALMNNAIAAVIAVGNSGCIHYILKESKSYIGYRKLAMSINNILGNKSMTSEQIYSRLESNQYKHKIILK